MLVFICMLFNPLFTHCCTVHRNSRSKMALLLRFCNRRLHTDKKYNARHWAV